MGDQSQEPVATWLLSLYRTEREPSGRLIVSVASPLGPILGCAVPAAFGALVTLFFRAAGASALLVLFAVIVERTPGSRGHESWRHEERSTFLEALRRSGQLVLEGTFGQHGSLILWAS